MLRELNAAYEFPYATFMRSLLIHVLRDGGHDSCRSRRQRNGLISRTSVRHWPF